MMSSSEIQSYGLLLVVANLQVLSIELNNLRDLSGNLLQSAQFPCVYIICLRVSYAVVTKAFRLFRLRNNLPGRFVFH